MSNEDRAEGFWWVRSTGAWFVALLLGGRLLWSGSTVAESADSECWTWGPYIGTEPSESETVFGYRVHLTAGDFLAEFIDHDRKILRLLGWSDSHAGAVELCRLDSEDPAKAISRARLGAQADALPQG